MTTESPSTATILSQARARGAQREADRVPINYAAAQREYRAQKTALTCAINSGNPDKVVAACVKAVGQWNQPGRAWPDEWSRWQRALDDALGWQHSVPLDDLV